MSQDPVYESIEEILSIAKTAKGKTVEQLNVHKRPLHNKNKGVIGQIVEEGVFGYSVNSRAEPDFAKLGVELKVTGLKLKKNNTFSAKERLVLNMIDYMAEANCDFETSSFWKKNANLLLMFYFYDDKLDLKDFKFIDSLLYTFPEEDLEIIKQDYQKIHDKIMNGQAHLISESDTMYLGACMKGANGEAVRPQPFSKIPASKRAYALKPSYLNHILHTYGVDEEAEHLVNVDDLHKMTFEMALMHKVEKYIGKTEKELSKLFGITTQAKHKFERISACLLGVKGSLNKCDELVKANIIAKSVRINKSNKKYSIKESVSLPYFEFKDIIKEDWIDSELRNYFYETKYMFFVYEQSGDDYVFKGLKFWNMPLEILDIELHKVWAKTIEVIKTGNIIKGYSGYENGKTIRLNNFPKMSENEYAHVRPHGRNAKDVSELPVKDVKTGATVFTKQCFWLNHSYILKILGY